MTGAICCSNLKEMSELHTSFARIYISQRENQFAFCVDLGRLSRCLDAIAGMDKHCCDDYIKLRVELGRISVFSSFLFFGGV